MLNSPPALTSCWMFFARGHAIDRRAEAGTKERVVEVFADDGVVAAAGAEDIHSASDFAVSQQRPPAIARYQLRLNLRNGRYAAKGAGVELLHLDAAEKRQRQPDQRADSVPEIVADAQTAQEGFGFVKPRDRMIAFRPHRWNAPPDGFAEFDAWLKLTFWSLQLIIRRRGGRGPQLRCRFRFRFHSWASRAKWYV